jgi:hypothetical protein
LFFCIFFHFIAELSNSWNNYLNKTPKHLW